MTLGKRHEKDLDQLLGALETGSREALIRRKRAEGDLEWLLDKLRRTPVHPDVVNALVDHPLVAADLRMPPATVVALAQSGDAAHARLLDDLIGVIGGGIRLASSPFVTADPEAWRQAERPDIYRDILDHGDLALADELGTTPDRSIVHLPPTGIDETLDDLLQPALEAMDRPPDDGLGVIVLGGSRRGVLATGKSR